MRPNALPRPHLRMATGNSVDNLRRYRSAAIPIARFCRIIVVCTGKATRKFRECAPCPGKYDRFYRQQSMARLWLTCPQQRLHASFPYVGSSSAAVPTRFANIILRGNFSSCVSQILPVFRRPCSWPSCFNMAVHSAKYRKTELWDHRTMCRSVDSLNLLVDID